MKVERRRSSDSPDESIRESERRLIQKELFRLEDQKEEAEQRFRNMFETALVGLFRADVGERTLTDVNLEAARIFGFESTDEFIQWVNTDTRAYSYFETLPQVEKLDPGDDYSFSTRAWKRDGEKFWAQFSVRYSADGRHIEGAVKDITDQIDTFDRLRQAKAEAEEANKAKSRFLATMSHEIRTPLNGIVGFAEIIIEGGCDQLDYARKILDESDRLTILINQLLDLSRLEANKITLENILLDLHQVLDEAEGQLKKAMKRKGLTYERRIRAGVPRWFIGDPMRLGQILSNLLSNAAKFSREGGIVLTVSRDNTSDIRPRIRFSVKDTGIGIPRDKQKAIFGIFEQADSSISRKFGGSGLGISICRELVTLMGGRLNVDSRVGEGSEFYFTIPVTPPPDTIGGVPAQRNGTLPGLENCTGTGIMVVEDYPPNGEIARHHLESVGCTVHLAENGVEALELLDAGESVDLIIMDMHMPGMDGLEATRGIRKRGITVPVIGMTASAYAEDRRRCLDSGMDDFITKPLRRADFLTKVVNWIGREQNGAAPDPNPGTVPATVKYSVSTASSDLRYTDFLREMGGDHVLAVEFYTGFIENTEDALAKAYEALERRDLACMHRTVHAVKGGAMNLMADALAEQAARTEAEVLECLHSGGNGRMELLHRSMERLLRSFEAFRKRWRQIRESDETHQG